MSNWFVDNSAMGSNDGSSLSNAWTSFASINQTSLAGGDIIYIYPGTGAYNERFTVTKGGNGTGQRIIYKGVSGSSVPILRGISATAYDNIGVLGLKFYHGTTGYDYEALRLGNCSGWLIQDNIFQNTQFIAIDIHGSSTIGNGYNIVRGNVFESIGIVTGLRQGGHGIICNGHHNLVEYNSVGMCTDFFVANGTGNIIRNNYSTYTSELEYPNFSAVFRSGESGSWTVTNNVYGYYTGGGVLYSENIVGYVAQVYQDGGDQFSFMGSVQATGMFNGSPSVIVKTYENVGTPPISSTGNMTIRISAGAHIDGLQGYGGTSGLNFESNWSQENESLNSHGWIIQNDTNDNCCNIVQRKNVYSKLGSSCNLWAGVDTTRIYNNTAFYPLYDKVTGTYFNSPIGYAPGVLGAVSRDARYFNNTWSYSRQNISQGLWDTGTYGITGLVTERNHLFSGNNLNLGTGNISGDPLFISTGYDGFRLAYNSILRGSGAPTAYTSGDGVASYNVIVTDPYVFVDGWTVTEGDLIKITTGGAWIRVSGVNYSTSTVTVYTPQTWSSGAGIWVKGTEDIGGRPYDYASGIQITNTTRLPLAVGPITLSATSTTPYAIRKVGFLVNGIPVGEVYDEPYELAYVSTGGSPTVEARAYNMWASPLLWASELATANGVQRLVRMGRFPRFKVYHSF